MFKKLASFFSSSASAIWNFLRPIATAEAGKALAALLPLAKSIVIQVAASGKLPNEKRDDAVAQLKSVATSLGFDVATSVLNAAIELAYLHVKTTQPDALDRPQ